jgi:hypothetical protein
MEERIIQRAMSVLVLTSIKDAVSILEENGVERDIAFFAVKAAEIMLRDQGIRVL